LHLQRQQAKVVSNVLLILLCCSLRIESLRSFRKKCVGLSPPNPFARKSSLPRITEDPPLVIVIMYFRIKVRKRFIGDILHIVILDFSDNILTLSVKIWCPGLVKRNYGQLAFAILCNMFRVKHSMDSGYIILTVKLQLKAGSRLNAWPRI